MGTADKPPCCVFRRNAIVAVMPHKVRIALDAMGGDHGAAVVVPGAELSLTRHPDIEFLLFGDRALIEAQLARHPALAAVSRVAFGRLRPFAGLAHAGFPLIEIPDAVESPPQVLKITHPRQDRGAVSGA